MRRLLVCAACFACVSCGRALPGADSGDAAAAGDAAMSPDAAVAKPPDLRSGCSSDDDCHDKGAPRCDLDSHQCVRCVRNADCPPNQMCVDHICSCDDGNFCPQDGGGRMFMCCNLCVDLISDPRNCGGCRTDCGKLACCDGFCSDTANDLTNCGSCGHVCTGGHATWACAQGACAIAACTQGFANCNGLLGDGCETNIASDANNCGACFMVCKLPHATGACKQGLCVVTGCDAGWADCNLDLAGCETNITSDVKNCGGCGKFCAAPNAMPMCVNGMCQLGPCTPAFGDCDNIAANGCEANLLFDAKNCGGCGKTCLNKCVNGVCN